MVAAVTMLGVWLLSGTLMIFVAPVVWSERDEPWGPVSLFVIGVLALALLVATIVLAWLVRRAYAEWKR